MGVLGTLGRFLGIRRSCVSEFALYLLVLGLSYIAVGSVFLLAFFICAFLLIYSPGNEVLVRTRLGFRKPGRTTYRQSDS